MDSNHLEGAAALDWITIFGQTVLDSVEYGCLLNLTIVLSMLLRRGTGRVGELTSSVNRRMMKNCDLLRAGRLR